LKYLILILMLASSVAVAQPPSPCSQPEASQFDFWVGSWEVHAKGNLVGRNVIAKVHGGCTIMENYHATGGAFEGSSFNWYDPADDVWHQVWVDNSGTRLDLIGGLENGSMVMSGMRAVQGQALADRITWTPNDDGTVRQVWDQTTDGGETWTTVFDGLYRKVEEGE
jgi:hypothetical protein